MTLIQVVIVNTKFIIMNSLLILLMIYYDKIDVCKCIDINKIITSKECIICNYWHFLGKGFKFQSTVCDGCHDALMMSIEINSIAILNIHGVDYQCIFVGIRKQASKSCAPNREYKLF